MIAKKELDESEEDFLWASVTTSDACRFRGAVSGLEGQQT